MTTDIRADGKKASPSAYERKIARQRPHLISQATLDSVARESAEYLTGLGKKTSGQ